MRQLDILLIHPNASQKIYQGLSTNFAAYEPPIWAAMIARYLLKKGLSVEIMDCEVMGLTIEQAFEQTKSLNPKIIAAIIYGQQPSASSQNMYGAELLMARCKELNIPRVYVGSTPTALPDFILQKDPECFVCAGEGPVTLYTLSQLSDWQSDKELSLVPGLCYSRNARVIKNQQATLITDLDGEMPDMAWELLPIERYRTSNWHSWTNFDRYVTGPFASIYTSLGCPFKCSFCMINSPFNQGDNRNNRIRTWGVNQVMSTLEFLADKGITNLKIADEMFVLYPNHFLSICQGIIDRGLKFNIWCYARIDTVKEAHLDVLKRAGVNWLGLGIESGNPIVRQEATKGKFNDLHIRDVISKINSFNMCATGNYIFGLPQDTLETMNETLDLALSLDTGYANFYCAMAYPGSQLHRDFSINNPSVLPENNDVGWLGYSQHSYETLNLPTDTLSSAEVLRFREHAFQTYFSNPPVIKRMTKKFGEAFSVELNKMMGIQLKRKLLE